MTYTFNLQGLVDDFDRARMKKSDRGVRVAGKKVPLPIALRSVSEQTKISTTTLSRLQRLTAYPDMETLLAVCAWMNESPGKYFVAKS